MSVSHSFENLDQPTLVFLSAAFAQLEVDGWLEKTEGRQKSGIRRCPLLWQLRLLTKTFRYLDRHRLILLDSRGGCRVVDPRGSIRPRRRQT